VLSLITGSLSLSNWSGRDDGNDGCCGIFQDLLKLPISPERMKSKNESMWLKVRGENVKRKFWNIIFAIVLL
jgi:hypothetical protein